MKKLIILLSFCSFLSSCVKEKEINKDYFYVEGKIIHCDNKCNKKNKFIVKRTDLYKNSVKAGYGFFNPLERKTYYPCSECISDHDLEEIYSNIKKR